MLTWGITAALLLFLFIISLIIFPPQFKNKFINNVPKENFQIPEVKINFDIIASPQLANLEKFESIQTEFDYTAEDQTGKKVNGKVSALNLESAKTNLEGQGLKVLTLQEFSIGRNEPFVPYY